MKSSKRPFDPKSNQLVKKVKGPWVTRKYNPIKVFERLKQQEEESNSNAQVAIKDNTG